MDYNNFNIGLSTLLTGIEKLYETFSDFEPELERVEIDHHKGHAVLYYGVHVPDNPLEKIGNTVDLERPLNFTLKEIRRKDNIRTFNIAQISDTEYQIPAGELDSAEEYRLIVTGRPSRDALDELIRQDQYKGRFGRKSLEYNVVYFNGSITWNDEPHVTVVSNYRDTITFDESYLPRKIREAMPSSVDKFHSEAWTTPYDPDSEIRETSLNREELPDVVEEMLSAPADARDWWFSAEVIGDFITIEGPVNYYDFEKDDREVFPPRSFTVISRTEFEEGQGMTEGTVVFQKGDFWEELTDQLIPES